MLVYFDKNKNSHFFCILGSQLSSHHPKRAHKMTNIHIEIHQNCCDLIEL